MPKIEELSLRMVGIRPAMFDRYPGDNNTKLKPEQKLYLASDGSNKVVLPIINLYSFLGAENTMSAAKKLHDARKYKPIAQAAISFTQFDPGDEIPFMRDGKPLYTDYCHHCDNHDVNRRMHEAMDHYDLWRFLA